MQINFVSLKALEWVWENGAGPEVPWSGINDPIVFEMETPTAYKMPGECSTLTCNICEAQGFGALGWPTPQMNNCRKEYEKLMKFSKCGNVAMKTFATSPVRNGPSTCPCHSLLRLPLPLWSSKFAKKFIRVRQRCPLLLFPSPSWPPRCQSFVPPPCCVGYFN